MHIHAVTLLSSSQSAGIQEDTTSITSGQERSNIILWSRAHLNVQFYEALQPCKIKQWIQYKQNKQRMNICITNEELELLTNDAPIKTKLKATVPGFHYVQELQENNPTNTQHTHTWWIS